MAARKPLVLVGGQIQQLQPGDTLNATVNEIETQAWTNGDATPHALGDVVFISAADTARRAKADSATTVPAVAIAMGAIANGSVGNYQTAGVVAGLAGLTAGAIYYLSSAAGGGMTLAAPSTAGQFVQELGVAISATEFLLRPRTSILL